jgi:S-formylglutathione hydrolase
MKINQTKSNKVFEGHTCVYEHESAITGTKMIFSTFEPKAKEDLKNCIIWLSGLTCTEENFITKAGAQRYLKDTNTMIICPDTSPRGLDLPGEHEAYDFGSGAGFYLNATTEGYKDHYRMYDYIMKEIVSLLKEEFNITNFSIMGHSMGGHGALVLGLREADTFASVSAFSPIVNPTQCPWGEKAFQGYLGDDKQLWNEYDATELLKSGKKRSDKILIEQGLADEFFENQLKTGNIEAVAAEVGQDLTVNYRKGYDHSYYFISTFIEEHINFHIKALI